MLQEAWSLPEGPSGSESSLVSQTYLVDTTVMSMQYSADTPLLLRGDVSLDLFFSHLFQPMVVLMQSSIDTTLVFWGDT
jgi:hypothetical protein